MSKKKNFTQEQKHLIKQCMIDADIMDLGKYETIDYVKSRLNLDFSEGSYKKFRSEILNNDESNVQWLSYYARQGFVEFYRKRITEMEMIQKETFKQWSIEINKSDSQNDKNLIVKLVAELRANNQQLTSLGMVTPIIATIKNIIDDKEKLSDASRYIHHSNPIQYKVSREKDTYDTTTGSEDAFNESTTDRLTEEEDKNRRF